MLYLETVEDSTFHLLKSLMGEEELKKFVLVGGTALSLQIGHRESIDLDLFTDTEFETETLRKMLVKNYDTKINDQSDKNFMRCAINNISVDIIYQKSNIPREIITYDNVRMANLIDISAMKILAIVNSGQRVKDFIDIAYLGETIPLKEILNKFSAKFELPREIGLKALAYDNDIDHEEKIVLLDRDYKYSSIKQQIAYMLVAQNTSHKFENSRGYKR